MSQKLPRESVTALLFPREGEAGDYGAPGMARSARDGAGKPGSESEQGSDLEVKVIWRSR